MAATSSSTAIFSPIFPLTRAASSNATRLIRLARDGQLSMFKHRGFWACMDTQRDLEYLNKLWASGQAPWAV